MKPYVSHWELIAPRKRPLENLDAGDEEYEGKSHVVQNVKPAGYRISKLWETTGNGTMARRSVLLKSFVDRL